jgi:hypothetical protein
MLSKGRKERQVKFVLKDWLVIMEGYAPIFNERRKKYRDAYGEDLPLHNLWLARKWKSKGPRIMYCLPGDEGNYDTYCSPLYTAVDTARKGGSKKPNLEELFGHGVDFYSLRHSFATNFLINALKADWDQGPQQFDQRHRPKTDAYGPNGSRSLGYYLEQLHPQHSCSHQFTIAQCY